MIQYVFCLTQILRYEREFNHAHRPAIRLIQEHDASAARPMVLCVSAILETTENNNDQASELELTDGWYKIRATYDAPLARAVAKGTLKVGSKIAISGAKVSSVPYSAFPPSMNLRLFSSLKALKMDVTHLRAITIRIWLSVATLLHLPDGKLN